jgi:two-component system nitrate/nitrite sensor histidine kinase NarX
VRLVDPQTRRLHLYVQEGLAEDFAREERCLDMGECLCGEAAQHGASIVQFLSPVAMQNVVFRCQRAGYRTVSVFTIRFHGQILGVFNLYFLAPHTISPQQRRMLETLGRNLGVAIESQRLASRDRELAVFEERNLLAQELHDSIAQSLAYLNLQAQMLDGALKAGRGTEAHDILVQMRSGIQESYEDVRELLTHFRTRAKHEDIEAGIRSALARFEAQTGVATSCAASGTGVPLPPEQQLQVLHIVQEALSNVRKHAGASRVEVEIRREPHYVFRLRDDGRGFDPQAPEDAAQAHVGLRIMQERAQRIGGRLAVRSHPGQGCEVTLALPAATPAAVESAAA